MKSLIEVNNENKNPMKVYVQIVPIARNAGFIIVLVNFIDISTCSSDKPLLVMLSSAIAIIFSMAEGSIYFMKINV